jgi:hypothetical protein
VRGDEMRSTDIVLQEYREANLEKRLNLFLECPSLRNRFVEIDQGEIIGKSSFATFNDEDTAV